MQDLARLRCLGLVLDSCDVGLGGGCWDDARTGPRAATTGVKFVVSTSTDRSADQGPISEPVIPFSSGNHAAVIERPGQPMGSWTLEDPLALATFME